MIEEDSTELDEESLIALSTKLAQVQFRLRQLAKTEDQSTRELLLKDLEKYAFEDEYTSLTYDTATDSEQDSAEMKRKKMLLKLREQMSKLEHAFKSHSKEPTKDSLEEINYHLGLYLNSSQSANQMSQDEIDSDWHGNRDLPLLPPPHTVPHQSKREGSKKATPIRHIQFEIAESPSLNDQMVKASLSKQRVLLEDDIDMSDKEEKQSLYKKSLSMMESTIGLCGSAMSKMVTCSTKRPESPPPTNSAQLRQDIKNLEAVVANILTLSVQLSQPDVDQCKRAELQEDFSECVSMEFTDALCSLLSHGIIKEKCIPDSLHGGGDFSVRMSGGMKGLWAPWKLFTSFYELKGGENHSNTPLNKLSSAFSLPVENGLPPRKSLLTCINKIEKTCENIPPSEAPQIKLSLGYLKEWIYHIVTTDVLVNELYEGHSFVVSAGFKPALAQLDRLKRVPSHPVVKYSVNNFTKSDAFLTR